MCQLININDIQEFIEVNRNEFLDAMNINELTQVSNEVVRHISVQQSCSTHKCQAKLYDSVK